MGYNMKRGNSVVPFRELGSSPAKQSYPSSSQKGPHGPKGTLDEVKRLAKRGKKGLKNIVKKVGGKTLGVVGMLSGKLSHADQPKGKKSEGEQIKDLLTKHKLKGGK